jgi:hypothetical protein
VRLTHSARASRSALVARNFQGTRELARCRLLDDESESNPLLARLMSEAVTALYLLGNGHTANLSPRVTNGNWEYNGPAGDTECHALWAAFRRARTHRQRLMLILEAQTLLRAAKLVDRAKVRGTPEWRAERDAKIAADPRPWDVLTKFYRVSKRDVRRAKIAAR